MARAGWITYHATHLEITRKTKPPFEQWEAEVLGSEVRRQSAPWWRGDLYNKGEEWYGDRAASVFDPMTMDLKTWQNNASVCKRIDPPRRREQLSYSHHAEVAYLDPDLQDEYLQRAIDNSLSVRQLRDLIKFEQSEDAGDEIAFAKRTVIERIGSLYSKLDNLIGDLPEEWTPERELLTNALHLINDARNSANNRKIGEAAQISWEDAA